MEKFTYRDYLEYLAEVQQNFSAMLSLYELSSGQELRNISVHSPRHIYLKR